MAGIDKTYVNKAQFLEAIDWCKSVGEVTLENGYKFEPLDFISYYDEEAIAEMVDGEEYVLWNTPTWFDRWLWVNCPLSFVRSRIEDVYSDEYLKKFEEFKYIPFKRNSKIKYKVLDQPCKHEKDYKWLMSHGRRKNPYRMDSSEKLIYNIEIKTNDDILCYEYDEQTNEWGDSFGMLPYLGEYRWNDHHKRIPTVKSILRQLRKWDIPSGYIVRVYQIVYEGLDFKILVK